MTFPTENSKFDGSSDRTLIEQSLTGDQQAYGRIVQRYQSLVCSVAYSRCGDLAMSEDLAQEAFIVAWQKLADLTDLEKFKSWICTIVRNLANRASQRSARQGVANSVELGAVAELPAGTSSPDQRMISQEQEQLVWQALSDMPENYREPMVLFYRQEQSVARVAEALDLSQDAVKQRLSRGRKMLESQLAATVESVLEQTKPSNNFAGSVVLALSATGAKTMAAAATHSATQGTSYLATTGSLSGLLGGWFIQLPVIAWLFKVSLKECRSDRERELTWNFIVQSGLALIPFIVGLVAFVYFGAAIHSPWQAGGIMFALMALGFIPFIVLTYRLDKQIRQLRKAENTQTPPDVVLESTHQFTNRAVSWTLGGGALIAIWPAYAFASSAAWFSLIGLIAVTIAVCVVGTLLIRRLPANAFQLYSVTLGVIVLASLALLLLNDSTGITATTAETAGDAKHLIQSANQFSFSCIAMSMAQVVLSTIVWRRLHGKQTK